MDYDMQKYTVLFVWAFENDIQEKAFGPKRKEVQRERTEHHKDELHHDFCCSEF
jgi:hypothetical protein